MRAALLAATIMCGMATGAEASVTYALTNRVYNQVAQDAGAFLNFSLTVSDAAVARGSFNLSGRGSGNSGFAPSYTGDLADFVSFTANETATPTFLFGNLAFNATFGTGGAITASSFTFNGVNEMSQLGGSSNAFGGTFGSDNFGFRCGSNACAVNGQLAATAVPNPVPEPVSAAVLGVGLLGLAAWRRRPAI